jgi:hypothetical protein
VEITEKTWLPNRSSVATHLLAATSRPCFEGLPDGAQREARTFLSGGADERRCPLIATPEPTFWTDIELPWQSIPS